MAVVRSSLPDLATEFSRVFTGCNSMLRTGGTTIVGLITNNTENMRTTYES